MAFIMTEVALQRLVQIGLKNLRTNRKAFDCIFDQYLCPEMEASYGASYVDKIYKWFSETKLPVLQAWSFDGTRVPAFTVHLADESEDESKAAMSDFWGMGTEGDVSVGVSTVSLDIGLHADRSKDHVLWMYYILTYIFYREKPLGRELGMQVYTFRANDYNKESKYMADNVWSRWVRFRCTIQNYIEADDYQNHDLELSISAESTSNDDPVEISNVNLSEDAPEDARLLDPNRYD